MAQKCITSSVLVLQVKKLCCSLRRNAKDERVLFHYNGHGVPKPTSQGEIWLFNRAFTQYIPLSMYDLQSWMGAPSLYVYDCSNAGVIVDNFKIFADQHERDYELQKSKAGTGTPPPLVSYAACLQLGACAAGQALPAHPELPADLFTACLTTPVKMAVRWFVLRSTTRVTPTNVHDLIDKIPGQVTDRRTMLGELNWIFTAITDTIAWNSLAPELFQQLFRADLLTASLCRNFLLADRIMRCYNCTPVSSPALPSLASHPLWQAWDQTLDLALAQLPACSPSRPPPDQLPMVLQVLLSTLHRVRALQILCRFLALGEWTSPAPARPAPAAHGAAGAAEHAAPRARAADTVPLPRARYCAASSRSVSGPAPPPPAQHQLPMVLQVLLSTLHRVRALQILCRFLALGEWTSPPPPAQHQLPMVLQVLLSTLHRVRALQILCRFLALGECTSPAPARPAPAAHGAAGAAEHAVVSKTLGRRLITRLETQVCEDTDCGRLVVRNVHATEDIY
ncbi:unnamed protein product [Plutella xylostella]|uniref:(diamondback moth) hypothetical protein n=1 Tax=Plutella xylostella TaxID=51655 RepID=A0A8S4D8R2_PLUXY|nr:unnamed protein product [Plutella xylostella]